MPRNYTGAKQKVLALLVEYHGTGKPLPPSKQIAAEIGVNEKTLSKTLYLLKQSGSLKIDGARVVARVRP
jgi:DNA-binding transcriptional regulator YhcF (GntR family)